MTVAVRLMVSMVAIGVEEMMRQVVLGMIIALANVGNGNFCVSGS